MKKVWDQMGITISSVCLVHCIIVAFVPLFIPALAFNFHSSWPHLLTGALILITTPFAFIPGLKKHGVTWILMVALLGLLLVLSGIFAENFGHSELTSHSLSIIGSLFLVVAHLKNIQHSHKHHHQCCC
jgi:MerC mercury resistance protein